MESMQHTEKPRLDLQGHRGARGARPENTLPAFIYCVEHNMTTIECDTHVTRDKKLIIHHDPCINSELVLTESGRPADRLPIKNLTVAELKRFDCGTKTNKDFPEQKPERGARMITLDELFDYTRRSESTDSRWQSVRFNIEAKFGDGYTAADVLEAARLMVAAIEKAGMVERSAVQSFAIELLPEIKKLNPVLKTAALFKPTRFKGLLMSIGLEADRHKIIRKALKVGADRISPHYIYANKPFVEYCHGKGLQVVPWTVNEKDKMEKLFNNGVDGIISDYPDRLFEVYKKWEKTR
jgi:glycerophosphoryl diester phosphodiesterase